MDDTQQRIHDTVHDHDVVLFMKGTPDVPMCGFSAKAAQILGKLGVTFHSVDVIQDAAVREGVKTFSQWPTLPQLYVKGSFVGGCDIMREMYDSGELQTLLRDKGVAGYTSSE